MKKKIFIAGASSDIGIAVVEKYLMKGWQVTAHYNKNVNNLKKIKKKYYKDLNLFKFNFEKILQLENFIKKNKNFFRNYDAFVSLAGLNKPKRFEKINIQHLINHLNVNYFSAFLISKEIINFMKKRKWGRILFTSSIGTKFGGGNDTFSYSFSKYTNEFFPKFFKEKIQHNILYNCLRIGVTDTKIHKIVKNKNMKKRIALIPIKRLAKPNEITDYIYFLCSEKNTLISNEVLNISGGE